MNQGLPLQSLEIEGFRGIRNLHLPELERVNLFVGKNNTGKTSLLEAAKLYAFQGTRSVLFELLREHGQFRPSFSRKAIEEEVNTDEVDALLRTLEGLFYGGYSEALVHPIRIGPVGLREDVLTVSLPWYSGGWPREGAPSRDIDLMLSPDTYVIESTFGDKRSRVQLHWLLRGYLAGRPRRPAPATLIPPGGIDTIRLSVLWDRAVLAGDEGTVLGMMRIIIPELDRIVQIGEVNSPQRAILLSLRGTSRPIPLRSMGDGAIRIFGLSLALLEAKHGLLLIDEIENGIHYTAQDEVWQALFALSEQMDVQVLATTHSWDTLVGFQFAANRSGSRGMLYRLEHEPDGRVDAIKFSEDEVEIAAEQQIEIR